MTYALWLVALFFMICFSALVSIGLDFAEDKTE